jgi:general secretion pathway protein F
LVEAVAQRVDRGETLDQAVAAPELNLPEVYSAIVRAGVRSGHLAVALEQLSATARRISELRRIVTMAAMYPLIVAFVGCVLFALVGPLWARLLRIGQEAQRIEISAPAKFGLSFAENIGPFALALPFLLLLAIVLWWWAAGRARSAQPAAHAGWFRFVPGLRRLLHYSTAATFCEVLGLLLQQDVPLDEALPLAGATTGDRKLQADAQTLARQIQGGQAIVVADPRLRRIPALVRWILASGNRQGRDMAAIHTAAGDYRQRAKHLVEWMQVVVPISLMVGVGALVAIVFSVTVFGPWSSFLNSVAESIGRM